VFAKILQKINEIILTGRNSVGRDIQKRGLNRKAKVSIVDIEIQQSGIRVFSSELKN